MFERFSTRSKQGVAQNVGKSQFSNDHHGIFFFKIFLLKLKKIHNFVSNYHRHTVQPFVLKVLKRSFERYPS